MVKSEHDVRKMFSGGYNVCIMDKTVKFQRDNFGAIEANGVVPKGIRKNKDGEYIKPPPTLIWVNLFE